MSTGTSTLRPAIAANGTFQVLRTTARPAENVISAGSPEMSTTLAAGALSALLHPYRELSFRMETAPGAKVG